MCTVNQKVIEGEVKGYKICKLIRGDVRSLYEEFKWTKGENYAIPIWPFSSINHPSDQFGFHFFQNRNDAITFAEKSIPQIKNDVYDKDFDLGITHNLVIIEATLKEKPHYSKNRSQRS